MKKGSHHKLESIEILRRKAKLRIGKEASNYKNGDSIREDNWIQLIYSLGPDICYFCGKPILENEVMIAHHIEDKENHPLFRFCPFNGVKGHNGCHQRYHAKKRDKESRDKIWNTIRERYTLEEISLWTKKASLKALEVLRNNYTTEEISKMKTEANLKGIETRRRNKQLKKEGIIRGEEM